MQDELLAVNVAAFQPVVALVAWTFVMWLWMFFTRVPAIQKAKIKFESPEKDGKNVSLKDVLPARVMNISDNYNHLHEQPTLFYAMAMVVALSGGADTINLYLLWGYVALRVVHSLIQATVNIILVRFVFFLLSSILLIAVTVREVIRLFF